MVWISAHIFLILISGIIITGVIEDFDNDFVKISVRNDDGTSASTELPRSLIRTHHCS